MLEENLMTLISQVGFPIVVCLWFMFRTEKVIKANTEALDKIRNFVMIKRCKEDKTK